MPSANTESQHTCSDVAQDPPSLLGAKESQGSQESRILLESSPDWKGREGIARGIRAGSQRAK
jgi:hypothetical protein